MPIRPEHRRLYPFDWPQLSSVIRFHRAKGSFEDCGRLNGLNVCHLNNGRLWDETAGHWRNGSGQFLLRLTMASDGPTVRTTRVVLATVHLDHDLRNNRPKNLKALCQRCHLLHDRAEHQRRRWLTLRARKALGDLFLGPYALLHQGMHHSNRTPGL